jgi:hypothetical protein
MAWGYSGASIINDDYCNGIKLDTTSRHLDTVHSDVKYHTKMPPLPTTPDDLYPSIKRRLDDIESFQLPRITKCGSVGLQRELAEEIKGDLELIRRSVEVILFLTYRRGC